MRKKGDLWTPQEIELAQSLIKQRATNEVFLKLLGRPKETCRNKLYRVQFPSAVHHYAGEKIKIPDQVIEDRNRRLMAQQRPFGDPPVGFSALEQRT